MTGRWLLKPSLRQIKGKLHVVTCVGLYEAVSGIAYEIPVGFETDGGSIPRPLWWWIPPFGDDAECAYVLHDFLYHYAEQHAGADGFMNRGEADCLLREAAEAAGYPARRANVVYAGVRAGGWKPWGDYRKGNAALGV